LRATGDRLTLPAMKTAAVRFAAPLAAVLFLSGCGWIFGPSTPLKVSGDANGVVVKNGSDTDQRELAASHCATFNKSALLLAPDANDKRNDTIRFACR
jgi:hypothetical protein